MKNTSRKNTNYLVELMDQESIDPRDLAELCLFYMTEEEVTNMMEYNDLLGNAPAGP